MESPATHNHLCEEPNGAQGDGESGSIDMHEQSSGAASAVAVAPGGDHFSQTLVPPYWQRHLRNDSSLSAFSIDMHTTPIRLEDHTEESSEQSKALWARSASIDDYVVISGATPGIGDYVVWNCTVETLNGGVMTLRKRYSEFDKLRRNLIRTFPQSKGSLPFLPPKSYISRFQPKFLEKRRQGLSYFLSCVLLNPEFAGAPILKEFLFS